MGRAAHPPQLDAKAKKHLRFAQELAGDLENKARRNGFHALCIIASSPFRERLKAAQGTAAMRHEHLARAAPGGRADRVGGSGFQPD